MKFITNYIHHKILCKLQQYIADTQAESPNFDPSE